MDHYFQIGAIDAAECECSRPTRRSATSPGARRAMTLDPRHRDRLPSPRPPREDRHNPRRAVRRTCVARHRRRVERARTARPRYPVPARRRAARAAEGDAPDLPADVARRRQPLRRRALPPRGPDERATGPDQAASADHDRRRGRRKPLRLVARYADANNLFPTPTCATSSTCCARTARKTAATTTRSPRPSTSSSTWARRARRRPRSSTSSAADPLGFQAAIGAVADVTQVTPLEVIAADVIPAVARL